MEKEKENLLIALYNVKRSYPEFVDTVACYAWKKPERLKAVQGYLTDNPNANSSDVLGFISMQSDFMEDAVYSEVV